MAQLLEFPTPDGNVQIAVREPQDIVARVDLSSPTPTDRTGLVGQGGGRPAPNRPLKVSWVGTAEVVKRTDGRRRIEYDLMSGKEEWW